MTLLTNKYFNTYIKIKYFLASYRALSDGKSGITATEQYIKESQSFLSHWKILWLGTCTAIRSSIDLFKVDSRSCINKSIREEIRSEWRDIDLNKENHAIYWEFLRKERNNVIHKYKWSAYEAWLDRDGTARPAPFSLLSIKPEDTKIVLMMRDGYFKGHDSIDLLKEAANWAEERILNAIRRAGFDPDEERNLHTFKTRPTLLSASPNAENSLLAAFDSGSTAQAEKSPPNGKSEASE